MSRRNRKAKPDETLFQGYAWSDGKLHPEPPPSSLPFEVAMSPTTPKPPLDDFPPPRPHDRFAADQPEVPSCFAFTDRSRLRAQAFDFALRAAVVMNHHPSSGRAILEEAENIEKWLANP
jgi:hypothetical protein